MFDTKLKHDLEMLYMESISDSLPSSVALLAYLYFIRRFEYDLLMKQITQQYCKEYINKLKKMKNIEQNWRNQIIIILNDALNGVFYDIDLPLTKKYAIDGYNGFLKQYCDMQLKNIEI